MKRFVLLTCVLTFALNTVSFAATAVKTDTSEIGVAHSDNFLDYLLMLDLNKFDPTNLGIWDLFPSGPAKGGK